MRKAQEDLTQQIRDISADVAEPVTKIQDQVKKEFTITVDDNAVARTVPKEQAKDAESPEPRASQPPTDQPSKPNDSNTGTTDQPDQLDVLNRQNTVRIQRNYR